MNADDLVFLTVAEVAKMHGQTEGWLRSRMQR